jgi:DNA polymerase
MEGMPAPHEMFDLIAAGEEVEAHNSLFEYWEWKYVCHERMGWPMIPLGQMRCSMSKSLVSGFPAALGNIGKAIPLPFEKLDSGTRLIKQFSCPPFVPHTDDIEAWQEFCEYNIRDVEVEHFVSNAIPDLSESELEIWKLDQVINDRGLHVDMELVSACLRAVDRKVNAGTTELILVTHGRVGTVRETAKLGEWLVDHGCTLPKTATGKFKVTKDSLAALRDREELSPLVERVLDLREELSLSSVDKLFTIANTAGRDNRIRGLLAYYGAKTGRWAGRMAQPQNLAQGGKYEDVRLLIDRIQADDPTITLQDVSMVLRAVFTAAPGHDLICSDYSAIEAVVLAEVAGEAWRQEVFRTHGKIYEMSASKITGVPFGDFEAHKRDTGDHHPLRKSIGKVAELASGYGGWLGAWKAFGADKHFSSDREIKDAILRWRDESPAIVEFWGGQVRKYPTHFDFYPERYGVEAAAVRAIENPDVPQVVNGYITYTFDTKRDALLCRLPSGRDLVYPEPQLKAVQHEWAKGPLTVYEISFMRWRSFRGADGSAPGWIREKTYGGRLVENIIQAISRDLLAYALLNLEAAGYPIVLHVHDEIIAEVPEGFGSVEEFERIMSQVPPWAEGWPVRASGGWRGKRYRK